MYASARGIVMSYHEALLQCDPSQDLPPVSAADIYQKAREGDALAVGVMRRMGRSLGLGIANLINIFNPEMVVIGGGVKDAWPLFIDATREEIKKRAFSFPAERTKIVPSMLGDDAGMIGAAAAALQAGPDRTG
jgi:glucokinase